MECAEIVHCVNCETRDGLYLVPHANDRGKCVGFLYICDSCFDLLAGGSLIEVNIIQGIPLEEN